ncbi:hypothetical protein [Kitasatospora indigofera]|uniref:hypothetical protein n=1 Tax=Kitasatospora indigofera TaxID=67307 RepID=UPI003249072D
MGADIFCREAQLVRPELRPFFDDRTCRTAALLRLPHTPRGLGALFQAEDQARPAAALVRVRRSEDAVGNLQAG